MTQFSGEKLTGAADLFYGVGPKKSFIRGLIGLIAATGIWFLREIPGTPTNSFDAIIGVITVFIGIPSAVFFFYGVVGYIGYKIPKTFYSITFVVFAVFLYKIALIGQEILNKGRNLPGDFFAPFIIIGFLEIMIIIKLIKAFRTKKYDAEKDMI